MGEQWLPRRNHCLTHVLKILRDGLFVGTTGLEDSGGVGGGVCFIAALKFGGGYPRNSKFGLSIIVIVSKQIVILNPQ